MAGSFALIFLLIALFALIPDSPLGKMWPFGKSYAYKIIDASILFVAIMSFIIAGMLL